MNISSIDYSEVWPDQFQEALDFLNSQHLLIEKVFGDDYELAKTAKSIGFPELLRYNSFKDFFEIKSLEIAYVKYGLDAVDFSIGEFQMKPSFAEHLENEIDKFLELGHLRQTLRYLYKKKDSIRKERLERLKSLKWQFIYLKAFIIYMYEKYPNLKSESYEYRVAFLASAYNYGFRSTFLQIHEWISVKAFPHGLKANVEQYAYADIARYFYMNYAAKNPKNITLNTYN
jgi:hypothetical protein